MTIAQFSLLLSSLTLITTIIGWRYTYNKQKAILEQTRTHAVRDRELIIFRERGKVFQEITNSLNLIAYGFAGRVMIYTSKILTKSAEELPSELKKFTQHLTGPDYLWVYSFLDDDAKERIDKVSSLLLEGVQKHGELRDELVELIEEKGKVEEEDNIEHTTEISMAFQQKMDAYSEYVRDLSLSCFIAAQTFSSEYSALERSLISHKTSILTE